MNRLLIATRNLHKVRELREMLPDLPATILTLADVPSIREIEEDAETLEGNALKKARLAFRESGIPTIADDTGLEVFYLNGSPGVYSMRYAGPGATYEMNWKKLLKDLKGVPPRRRGAQFRCLLAFVPSPGNEELVEGVCKGVITESPRGLNGFGYDPVFQPVGYSETFAEMSASLKNEISHRGRALKELKAILPKYFVGS